LATTFTRAQFFQADLEGVDFGANAEFKDAELKAVNLVRAQLPGADLRGAELSYANLTGANLNHANFTRANLKNSTLEDADLSDANLTGANLDNSKLKGADLSGANVEGADFDLLPDSLPDPVRLSSARGLQLVKFSEGPAGLVELRKGFKDLGLRTQENQVTYAIRRAELCRKNDQKEQLLGRFEKGLNYVFFELIGQCKEKAKTTPKQPSSFVHSPIERGLNYVLFDLTCQYGMSPGRPLVGVVRLAGLFALIYVFAQYFPGRRGGIWIVWEQNRIDMREGENCPQKLTAGFPSSRSRGWRLRRCFNVFMLAAYFSLLSALRIGWGGLNFGIWISRMQPSEYALHATGWVRVVSGLQSLVSVYLVALTILTYFGTPFEY
jgi:hypothetical protein